MNENFNLLLRNKIFQRWVYFVFLLLWSLALLSKVLYCSVCESSLGISYRALYFPFAILLLIQSILNSKIIWFICFIILCTLTIYVFIGQINFYENYKTKIPLKWYDLLLSFWILIPIIFIDIFLFKIRPTK